MWFLTLIHGVISKLNKPFVCHKEVFTLAKRSLNVKNKVYGSHSARISFVKKK